MYMLSFPSPLLRFFMIKEKIYGRFIYMLLALAVTSCVSLPDKMPFLGKHGIDQQLLQRAEAGDAASQYRIGVSYTLGANVWQDDAKSVEWFKRAAKQGHSDAAYMLGSAYYTGRGTEKNQTEAVKWFRQAARKGQMQAQHQLGEAYLNGMGVKKDQPWGARWIGKSAIQGFSQAQFSLGVAFATGLGLPKNRIQGLKWLILAEQAGHSGATQVKEKLFDMMSSQQIERAEKLAKRWRRSSRPGGYTDRATIYYIQYRLSKRGYDVGYIDGANGPRTEQAARAWLKIASGTGEKLMKAAVKQLRQGAD